MTTAIVTVTPNPALDLFCETDRVVPNRKIRTGPVARDPGGGGLNVSRMVKRLGGETRAIAAMGGPTGQQLAALLAGKGFRTTAVPIAGNTRTSFVVRSRETNDLFRFVTPGPRLAEADAARLLEAIERDTAPGDFLVGSGSLAPGLPPHFWADAARQAARAEARFVLDSATGAEEALKTGLFLLRVNHTESIELFGCNESWPDGAERWAVQATGEGRCQMAVVTHGSEGAILATEGRVVRAAPPEVPVVSAVGAGDSFVAALCWALSSGRTPEDALGWAVAAAAATMGTPGTALSDKAEIEAIRNQM